MILRYCDIAASFWPIRCNVVEHCLSFEYKITYFLFDSFSQIFSQKKLKKSMSEHLNSKELSFGYKFFVRLLKHSKIVMFWEGNWNNLQLKNFGGNIGWP